MGRQMACDQKQDDRFGNYYEEPNLRYLRSFPDLGVPVQVVGVGSRGVKQNVRLFRKS